MIKNINLFYFTFLVIGIGLVYVGIGYYNSDEEKFNRYLNQIASIERVDVKAIDVSLSKNDIIFRSYFDEEKAYLMLELLHEIKHLEQESVTDNEMDYPYSIRNAIETSKSQYALQLEVNENNYNIRINQIDVDRNNNKKITATRYFKANSKSTALLKELLSASNN